MVASALSWAPAASAQTWVPPRTTPSLAELVAIDATGEPGWLFGSEDLAGDGAEFKQPEQSIDVRTAYAATNDARFWVRAYVSDPNAVGGNVVLFVFVDADASAASGGSAAASEIHAGLTTDPSPGGYEYVIEIRGNGMVADVWSWRAAQMQFQTDQVMAMAAVGEAGQDVDPIVLNGAAHGYLQAAVDLDVVGLAPACQANLFFRSIQDASGTTGDLDVGVSAPCVPADADGDDVPDVLVPDQPCTADTQCPGGGICIDGTCILPQPCIEDADCDPDETCSAQGACVPQPSGTCDDSADCGTLVCSNGTCGPCTSGGSECGPARRCAPTGECLGGGPSSATGTGSAGGLDITGSVQGGACSCDTAARDREGSASLVFLMAAGLLGRCRRRRPTNDLVGADETR